MTDPRKLDRSRFSIVPIGSAANGFALKVDGVVVASDSCMIRLAAKVDALMAGASDFDADLIAKAIARRPWPSYEERLAVFDVPNNAWARSSQDPSNAKTSHPTGLSEVPKAREAPSNAT
jgi:hypothetical protein